MCGMICDLFVGEIQMDGHLLHYASKSVLLHGLLLVPNLCYGIQDDTQVKW